MDKPIEGIVAMYRVINPEGTFVLDKPSATSSTIIGKLDMGVSCASTGKCVQGDTTTPEGGSGQLYVQIEFFLAKTHKTDVDKDKDDNGFGWVALKTPEGNDVLSLVCTYEPIPPADWYSKYTANNPWTMWSIGLITILLFVIVGVIITFKKPGGFKLTGATVGFENRGSEIAGEILVLENLIPKAECTLELTQNPTSGTGSHLYEHMFMPGYGDGDGFFNGDEDCYAGYITPPSARRRVLSSPLSDVNGTLALKNLDTNMEKYTYAYVGSTSMHHAHTHARGKKKEQILLPHLPRLLNVGDYGLAYDPDLISKKQAYAIMEGAVHGAIIVATTDSTDKSDLMTAKNLKSMAKLSQMVKEATGVWEEGIDGEEALCRPETFTYNSQIYETCQPDRSLPNYIAALAGTSVNALTDNDVNIVKTYLVGCRPFYDDQSLVGNCWDYSNNVYTAKYDTESSAPACVLTGATQEACAKYNAVYDIFNALTPTGYLNGQSSSATYEKLTESQILLSNYRAADPVDMWEKVSPLVGRQNGAVEIANIYTNSKSKLFNSMMLKSMGNFIVLFFIIYGIVLYHTGSFWLATCGCFGIVMSFFWGFVFYNVILWRSFFPFLNLVALFLIMGIGADDTFIYVDAWKQSFTLLPPSCPLANRLSWVLRRAGGAMLITTITTSISFFANMVSEISALKAFGLFTACVVLADFALMILFFPATMATFHLHFSKQAGQVQLATGRGCCNCSPGHTVATEDEMSVVNDGNFTLEMTDLVKPVSLGQGHRKEELEHNFEVVDTAEGMDMGTYTGVASINTCDSFERAGAAMFMNMHQVVATELLTSQQVCSCLNCCCCVTSLDIDYCAVPTTIDSKTERLDTRWGEKFFEHTLSPLVLHRWGRWAFFFILLGLSSWLTERASHLERPSSAYMQMLDAQHPEEQYEKTYVNHFDIGDGESFQFPYYFVYGVVPVDNGDAYNPADKGSLEYVDIDIALPDSQQHLLDICYDIAEWDKSPQSSPSLNRNPCLLYWFKTWMEVSCSDTGNTANGHVLAVMPSRSTCCDKVDNDFPYDVISFSNCLGDFSAFFSSHEVDTGLWYDVNGAVKAIKISGSSTVKFTRQFEGADIYFKEIKQLFESFGTTPGLPGGWASTELRFYATQKAIVEGAWGSARLSIFFALTVLALMTRRIISSFLAAIQITLVVGCVLGVFVLLGWKLNIIESIIMSVSVGVACDFSAHLAHMFNETVTTMDAHVPLVMPRSWKELSDHISLATAKATGSIRTLGVTLCMGFLTTFIAGCQLMGGSLYFFQQFGIFMTTLMAFSLCLSFMFLMPLLATFGWVDRIIADWWDKKVLVPLGWYQELKHE